MSANSKASISFSAIQLNGPGGVIKVVADRSCPDTYSWGLDLSTWDLSSAGQLVHIVEDDGNKMLRQSSSDGVEVRLRSYSNLLCRNPAANICVTLPSL
jgi:hypothetical protein